MVGKADADGSGATDMIKLLDDLDVSVYRRNAFGVNELKGLMDIYNPKWGSRIENKNGNLEKGMLLIVRHPRSGVIHTYYADGQFQANKTLSQLGFGDSAMKQVDFCIDVNREELRRSDIRIVKDARSASGVEVVETDGTEYDC